MPARTPRRAVALTAAAVVVTAAVPVAAATVRAHTPSAAAPLGCSATTLPGTAAVLPLPLACPVPRAEPQPGASRPAAAGSRALPAAPTRSGPAGAWAVVPSPNPRRALPTLLYGADCPTTNDCWVVGWSSAGASTHPVAEHWDGDGWTVVPTPAPKVHADLVISGLDAVTCPAPRDCWAVGTAYAGMTYRPLVEHWDGRAWTIAAAPATGEVDILLGVTCRSADDCWTVGETFRQFDCPAQCGNYSLAEHWDGQRWRIVSTPDPYPGTATTEAYNVLAAASCDSGRDCWAVGYTYDGFSYHALRLRWRGRGWTVDAALPDRPAAGSALLGVSCPARGDCWASGLTTSAPGGPFAPLLMRWHGGEWSDAAIVGPALAGALFGVSCAGPNACAAAGYVDANGHSAPLVTTWDGTRWIGATADAQDGRTRPGSLRAVACPVAAECVAAGDRPDRHETPQPLVAVVSSGHWRVTVSRLIGIAGAALGAVSCAGRSDCWAVGADAASALPLAERWDGERWVIVPVALPPGSAVGQLLGATCVSGSSCWAVGWSARGGSARPLAEHWDGRAWRYAAAPWLPSPPPSDVPGDVLDGGSGEWLSGIACARARDCWAVGGDVDPSGLEHPLIEHWSGGAWHLAPVAPADADPSGVLTGITCSGADDCWAVGSGVAGALLEHWTGVAWTAAVGPTESVPVGSVLALNAVTCPAPDDCWAVGATSTASGNDQPLAWHWNGTAWSVSSADDSGVLASVSCTAPTKCWAVGAAPDGLSSSVLVEQWNGRQWTSEPSPNLPRSGYGSAVDMLTGVDCGRVECWSVGEWSDGLRMRTLVERYRWR